MIKVKFLLLCHTKKSSGLSFKKRLLSIAELKMGFDAFDPEKKGIINTDMVGTILSMMGLKIPTEQLQSAIAEADPFGALKSNNHQLCRIS